VARSVAKTNSLRDLCYDDLGTYYLALHPNYDYVPFQQERIVPVLEGVECGDVERLMVFLPSGHSKSDLITKTLVPWFLGRNPGKNVILLTHTDPLAKDFGSDIRNTMSTNTNHLAIFPNCRIDNRNHAGNFFRTSQGNAFYAFGMDGGVTGRRADLIIIDDPHKSIEEALSDLAGNTLYSIYKGVIKDRLRPGGAIVLAMTRWAVRDLAGRILEEEAARWKVLVLKAEEDNAEGQPSGHYLWESFFGRDRYEEAKQDSYIWNAKWQQTPAPQLTQGFDEDWLRFYIPDDRKPEYRTNPDGTPGPMIAMPTSYEKLLKFNNYVLVDPAMGKDAAHDRSCILVLAAGPEKRLFLVDAVLDRLDPVERIEHLVRLARLWKPKVICYEEYALQADTVFLKLKLEAEGITDLNVISVGRKAIKGLSGGRLKKHDRIIQLQADFRESRIWLPRRMLRKQLDGAEIDLVHHFITREYLPYAGEGSIAHEDMLDCMSRIHDSDLMIEYREREVRDEYYDDGYQGGGSWEANY